MTIFSAADALLIELYRFSGNPLADYFPGTLLLAVLCVLAGEFTMKAVARINARHLRTIDGRLEKMKRLSAQALDAGDKEGYRACNKEANDAFGEAFFGKFGLSAASFWPAFLALAWMQERFLHIEIPIPWTGLTLSYFATFLACYVTVRISYGRIRRRVAWGA